MRTWFAACLAALAVGCGSEHGTDVVATTGTVEFQDVEGGVWLIRAENGTLYQPLDLPDAFKVVGTRVEVRLVERRNLSGVPAPGVTAEIVGIEAMSCAGVMCGVPEPPVIVPVSAVGSPGAVEGVTLTNVSAPTPPPGSGGLVYGCATESTQTTCFVDAIAPGTYAFDVTAPGYAAAHVTVEVAANAPVPGVCCASPWEAQTIEVSLSPAG